MSFFSITTLNIATQSSLALHLAIFTSIFDPSAAALFLSAYIYRDVVLHANVGELQAILFAKKYDAGTIDLMKLLVFFGLSLVQLSVWVLLLMYLKVPYPAIAIIFIEYLMFYPINQLKGHGKIGGAMVLQFTTSLCGLLTIALLWLLNINDIEFYMEARSIVAAIILLVIMLLAKKYVGPLTTQSKKLINTRNQLEDGFFLQAKELYLLGLLTIPKFIASNMLEPKLFTKFMVAFAAMSASSSLLQAMHQKNLYIKLNEIQTSDLNAGNIFIQAPIAAILTFICYFAGVFWVNKSLIAPAYQEIEPVIILLYAAPVLLIPNIFIKFRTEYYNKYYILPVLLMICALGISIKSNDMSPQILLMLTTTSIVLFAGKQA